MIQFYSPDIAETRTLPESDSAHCCRVLRMKEGDEVVVVDGKGNRYHCVILEAHPKRTSVEIVSCETLAREWNVTITLAVAPTKHSDRMEWMIEKAVEIGIDRVVPVRCGRSERKVLKTERLEKVMISAMKQSLKAHLPAIDEVTDLKTFLTSLPEGVQKYMGYCDSKYPRREFVKEFQSGKDVVLLIGPEGDFTPEEVQCAVDNGFVPVTFGNTRLRTETAALYGVTAVHVLEDLHN